MKRMIIALVVLLIATPAMAAVEITGEHIGSGVVQIDFNNTNPNNVRAIALDIEITSGAANVTSVIQVNADVDAKGYDIYPGSIVSEFVVAGVAGPGEAAEVNITDWGKAECDGNLPGTLGGVGTQGLTVEMGSLYIGAVNEPGQEGLVVKFQVDESCTITVTENTIRGGIVMENPDEDPGVSGLPLVINTDIGCLCYGDLVEDTDPGDPNKVTSNDLFDLLGDLMADNDGKIYENEAYWNECADLVEDQNPGEPNVITSNDLFNLLGDLMTTSDNTLTCR